MYCQILHCLPLERAAAWQVVFVKNEVKMKQKQKHNQIFTCRDSTAIPYHLPRGVNTGEGMCVYVSVLVGYIATVPRGKPVGTILLR